LGDSNPLDYFRKLHDADADGGAMREFLDVAISFAIGGGLGWITGKLWAALQKHNRKKDGK